MRKMIAHAASALAFAIPAFAAPMTLEFVSSDGGDPVTVTLLDDGTYMLSDETSGTYSLNSDGNRICGMYQDANLCVTFSLPVDELTLGEPATFTTNAGSDGTVTKIFAAPVE